jgi:hypothetical protein
VVTVTLVDPVRLVVFMTPTYPVEMPVFELKGVSWHRHSQEAIYEGETPG